MVPIIFLGRILYPITIAWEKRDEWQHIKFHKQILILLMLHKKILHTLIVVLSSRPVINYIKPFQEKNKINNEIRA